MSVIKLFDAYSLRARLLPALLAAAPSVAALMLLITWKSLDLTSAFATLATFVLLYALSDFARRCGRSIEQQIFANNGGMPSIVLFRRNDTVIDEGSKERYRNFLAKKLSIAVLSSEAESEDQQVADKFYEQCGVWLRENTRDVKKFSLLFSENVTYGFRRNIFGLKRLAIGLNLLTVIVCVGLLWNTSWSLDGDRAARIEVIFLIAFAHLVYMIFVVRESVVLEAANVYARQLILSCESFLTVAKGKK
jgi:hypothetical protein